MKKKPDLMQYFASRAEGAARRAEEAADKGDAVGAARAALEAVELGEEAGRVAAVVADHLGEEVGVEAAWCAHRAAAWARLAASKLLEATWRQVDDAARWAGALEAALAGPAVTEDELDDWIDARWMR